MITNDLSATKPPAEQSMQQRMRTLRANRPNHIANRPEPTPPPRDSEAKNTQNKRQNPERNEVKQEEDEDIMSEGSHAVHKQVVQKRQK